MHRYLGPGLLESTYEECLARELVLRGRTIQRQKPVPLVYKGAELEAAFRADMIVDGLVLVELKSVQELTKIHTAQLLTYLRLTGCKLGLLLNFNTDMMRNGIKRMVLDL